MELYVVMITEIESMPPVNVLAECWLGINFSISTALCLISGNSLEPFLLIAQDHGLSGLMSLIANPESIAAIIYCRA